MSMGAQRADAQPEDGTADTHEDWGVLPATNGYVEGGDWPVEGPEEHPRRARALGWILAVLAIAWTAAAIWSIARGAPALTLPNALQWISFVTPPLILLGIAWIILGQTPRKETERFTRAVAALRSESSALESVLAIVATRLEENHSKLRGEATKLMSLGDEASDRLGRVTYYLSKESANLDKKSLALETAAEAARVDIGVLLQDLPKAEEQARSVAEAMKEAGLTAHNHAGALEGQLSALVARGREADEVAGGAAQRLASHLARVESTTASASARLEEAATSMNAAVDGTMARAAEAIDATRSSIDAQGSALFAAIEQNRAALQHAGDEATRKLKQRLEAIGEKIEGLSANLSAQDAASHALIGSLHSELAGLDESFTELARTGTGNAERLEQSLAAVRASVGGLSEELAGGNEHTEAIISRTRQMAEALGGVGAQLADVPAGLVRVETQAVRTHKSVAEIAPAVAELERASSAALAKLGQAEDSMARQHELLEASGTALATYLLQRLGEVEEKLNSLREVGGSSTLELGESITGVRDSVADLASSLVGNRESTEELAARASQVSEALAAISVELDERLPASLARVEEQATRTRSVSAAMLPDVEAVQASADAASARLAEAEASLSRQQQALDQMLANLTEGVAVAEGQLHALGGAALEADRAASQIVAKTGPDLIDALLRVREAANQAAERARETIGAVIPQSAATLAEASRVALTGAISGPVEERIAELNQVAARAVDSARTASERLTRQMLKIGETAAAVEARIDDARKDREEKDAETFSRRVALLIESLNSTAIDVTKILSNEVTDSAWAAYLKGDRGVFTRRAVRLLDNAEARAIIQHYEAEPEFREQVNRYIHDFEAMLRRILADRDSSALGVTILSSDMGKLYVALAQAIERLR
jgi:hypothetical protein